MKWRVIVKEEGIYEKFDSEEDAEVLYKELSEEYDKVALLNLDIEEPPSDFKKYGNNLWCPYCGEKRKFVRDTEMKVKLCSYCGISESSYYVKQFNDLWGFDK